MTIKVIKFFSLAYQNHKFYFSISIVTIHLDILLVNKLKVLITILKGILAIVLVN